ncbi:MAG: 50S ribosomal protein L3 [Candidatus Paceibacterota bacterium]
MRFILGTKQYMTQVFNDEGVVFPATVISAGPIVVTQVKSKEKDKYEAVQVGFGEKRVKNISKSLQGHSKELGNFQYFKEFKTDDSLKVGDKIDVSIFKEGDIIEISAISKGKGFQGVVKRHGFKGGPRSHGQKHSEREPGSISGGTREGGRVPKGMRMAGRMGGDRITVKSLKVVRVDLENNEIYVKGAVPGRKGTLVEVKAK